MNVLLDRCVPKGFRDKLLPHRVSHASEYSWGASSNGELIRAAEAAGFDVLITVDRNMPHQTPMPGTGTGVVVIEVENNRLTTLAGRAPAVLQALTRVQPGTYESV
ncbi:MAG: hypothetical protein ACYC96_14300 [Fimbriimonadaceae bacterium]